MTVRVGEVIAVRGVQVTLRIDENSNHETLYYRGQKFKGVSIREYLAIRRGFREIVCMIEGEYLDENRVDRSEGSERYIRKVEARPIGHFDESGFKQGIKYLPMIHDPAFLLDEARIASIFERHGPGDDFRVGTMLKEGIPVSLPWKRLFNSHIGIFGNTGSGKSNTLAKLFTVLFERKLPGIEGKSRFVIIDFNGEYTGDQLVPPASKIVYQLATKKPKDGEPEPDRFPLLEGEFWDLETLSVLFQATPNTQRPFLSRLIEGRQRFERGPESLAAYAKKTIKAAFCAGQPKAATLDLVRSIADLVLSEGLPELLKKVNWHSKNSIFFSNACFFEADGVAYEREIAPTVETLDTSELDAFGQLVLRANLQLIRDLVRGYVQFEHIQPLVKRIESWQARLRLVLSIGGEAPKEEVLLVVSLRRCDPVVKRVLPLLFAKYYYNTHKDTAGAPPGRTLHIIIDEAHNILSEQSSRESESWKDYRLEQFEEIIKEGRKFGVFITLASQRPADISPTIVSQLHNFFIHRLVNDRDLYLIDNTITTLDSLSRSLIPSLAQGSCVATGTAFDLPMMLQMDLLEQTKQPASEDVDLEKLWHSSTDSHGQLSGDLE